MMTVSALARMCGLSRTTLLYYESQGLLRRPPRTSGNYRAYGEEDLRRVGEIGLYRKVGLSSWSSCTSRRTRSRRSASGAGRERTRRAMPRLRTRCLPRTRRPGGAGSEDPAPAAAPPGTGHLSADTNVPTRASAEG
ncbi:MAG: MerR family DNA-binding transcriptional regulator [Acidobacteriota bacterium]